MQVRRTNIHICIHIISLCTRFPSIHTCMFYMILRVHRLKTEEDYNCTQYQEVPEFPLISCTVALLHTSNVYAYDRRIALFRLKSEQPQSRYAVCNFVDDVSNDDLERYSKRI